MRIRSSCTAFGALLLAALLLQRGEAAPAPPALYTQAQARQGRAVFEQHCASCHGRQLEGRVAPALKGAKFASVQAGFTIQQIFEFLSVEMPAYAPGSLAPSQYVEITAFLLQQNGYPAGSVALTDRIASHCSVPFLYHKASGAAAAAGAAAGEAPQTSPPPPGRPPQGTTANGAG